MFLCIFCSCFAIVFPHIFHIPVCTPWGGGRGLAAGEHVRPGAAHRAGVHVHRHAAALARAAAHRVLQRGARAVRLHADRDRRAGERFRCAGRGEGRRETGRLTFAVKGRWCAQLMRSASSEGGQPAAFYPSCPNHPASEVGHRVGKRCPCARQYQWASP